ncbi:hypothetical protein CEXT_566261 [Caerostris extrusa]|uniref:Uncharacterized protein n=1 Tax=Caerostris extrusa TaxID=172846 RepID=A0AAV4RTY6_CAEEX|nr:hypothetical protein CEXT_566261 [Caerostris extrusa]
MIDVQKTRSDANGGAKARMINRPFTEKESQIIYQICFSVCVILFTQEDTTVMLHRKEEKMHAWIKKLARGNRFHDRRSKTRSDANGGANAGMINRPFREKGKPDY